MVSDSIYVPVNDVRGHRLDFKMVQLKTKTMTHVEANVEGEPASTVFTQVWSLTQISKLHFGNNCRGKAKETFQGENQLQKLIGLSWGNSILQRNKDTGFALLSFKTASTDHKNLSCDHAWIIPRLCDIQPFQLKAFTP